jgi:hypothetical protein
LTTQLLSARLRTQHRGEQRGPAAQPLFRQTLLDAVGEELEQASVRVSEIDAQTVAARAAARYWAFLDLDPLPVQVLDRILVIKGRIDHKQQGETKLIALEVAAFEAVQERTEIRFKLDARVARAGLIKDLAHLVKDYPGPSMVFVSLETSLGPKTLALGPDYRVAIDTDFLTEARTLLGADAIL